MNGLTEGLVTIFTAIIGVAILATLVSNRAQTANVIGAFGSAFANAVSAATGPVTGKAATPNVGNGGAAASSQFSLGNLSLPSLY